MRITMNKVSDIKLLGEGNRKRGAIADDFNLQYPVENTFIIDGKTLAESADEVVTKLGRIIDNNAVVYPDNDVEQR